MTPIGPGFVTLGRLELTGCEQGNESFVCFKPGFYYLCGKSILHSIAITSGGNGTLKIYNVPEVFVEDGKIRSNKYSFRQVFRSHPCQVGQYNPSAGIPNHLIVELHGGNITSPPVCNIYFKPLAKPDPMIAKVATIPEKDLVPHTSQFQDVAIEADPITQLKTFSLMKAGIFRLSRSKGVVNKLGMGNCGVPSGVKIFDNQKLIYFCPNSFMTGSFPIDTGFKEGLYLQVYSGWRQGNVCPQISLSYRDEENLAA